MLHTKIYVLSWYVTYQNNESFLNVTCQVMLLSRRLRQIQVSLVNTLGMAYCTVALQRIVSQIALSDNHATPR